MFGLLAIEIFWLIRWASGSWADKISIALGIVGIYGLAIGFFSKTPAMHGFRESARDLTSTNVVDYLVGNFIFLSFLFNIASIGLSSRSEPDYPKGLRFAGGVLWILVTPVLIAYTLVHLLVVVPVTYVPNFVASAMVASVAYAGRDIEVASNLEGEVVGRVSVKSIIKDDQLAAKGFLMGLPSIIISFIGQLLPRLL